jgi:small conductance mechanosensitive channel
MGGAWLAILAFHLLVPAGLAQDAETTVRLDGRALFRVSEDGEISSERRADRVEQRLASLLENLETIPRARIISEGAERVVTVAGVPVTRVLPLDAENNLTNLDDLASQWAATINRELARAHERRLGPGGRFVAETRGAVQNAFAGVAESAVRTVPRVLAALLVISAFVLLAWAVHRLLRALFRRTVEDRTLENLIKQSVYYAIILLGVIIAAGALDVSPQALVTGLGLTGLVFGFALKDILSNFVSGLLILALRPFKIGDQIVVGETEGAVERIELRATQIRTYDGRVALVPNAEVFTSRIVNNTADPIRRGNVAIRAGYDIDLQTALPILREAAAGAPGVIDRPVAVRVEDLCADDLEIVVSFWSDSRRSDFKDTCSAVRSRLLAAMAAAGISYPQPELRRLAPAEVSKWREVFDRHGE